MNAVLQKRNNEVDVGTIEATEAKIDALRDSDLKSLRDKVDKIQSEMHTGFAALRESIAAVQAELQTSIASVQTTLQANVAGVQTSLQTSIAAVQTSLQTNIAAMQTSLQANIAGVQTSLQTSVAGLQASVAELRGMMKTMVWAIGLLGMAATIFFTAGKALHWF